MKRNSPRLTDGISRFLITVMGIVMMIAGIRLLIMGVDNFIQPIRHVGWVTTSANVTDISETIFYKGIMPSETGFRFSSGL